MSKLVRTKSRHHDLIENQVRDVVRPMKGLTERGTREMEAIAKKYMKKTAQAHVEFMQEVFDIFGLGDFLSTEAKGYISKDIQSKAEPFVTYELHDNHWHEVVKAPKNPGQTNVDFERLFGRDIADKLTKSAKDFINKLMDSGKVDPGKSKAVFQDMYFDTVISAGDDAFRSALAEWEKQSKAWKEANPFTGNKTTFFDNNTEWIKKMYNDGYQLVTSSITEKYLPAIKELMNQAYSGDIPYTPKEIAYLMRNRFKDGGLSHWDRLVRTELKMAQDKEHHERFQTMGNKYVRWSSGTDACNICLNYKRYNKGYYKLELAPRVVQDTHPRCGCTKTPVWNLRKGIDENGNEADARAELQDE